jgi:hypothetical protein
VIALQIVELEVTEHGTMIINKIAVLDTNTMEEIRPAKITPELGEFFKALLFDVEKYHNAIVMSRKNPALKTFINELKLM